MCLPSCVFRDLGGPALAPDIKKDINMFQLEGYAQHYFRTVKKGLFKRTVPVRELLVWSKVQRRFTHALTCAQVSVKRAARITLAFSHFF
jgi:hypothetical protein